MKKTNLAVMVGLAIGGFCLLFIETAFAEMATNLLNNGSFSGGLNGWTLENPQLSQCASIDHSVVRGSNPASLKLSAESGKVIVFQRRLHDVKAPKYRVSGWSKCSGLSSNWEAGINVGGYLDAYKGKSYENPLRGQTGQYYTCSQADGDWTRLSSETRDVPPDTAELCVQLFLRPIGKMGAAQGAPTGAVWFTDISLEPVSESAKSEAEDKAPVLIERFYALGMQGLFSIGQPVQIMINGRNRMDRQADLEIEFKVKDFFDVSLTQKVFKASVAAKKDFRQTLELDSPGKYGFFSVNAKVKNNNAVIMASPEASFCVLRERGEKDPFFMALGNDWFSKSLIKAMQWMGIGSKLINVQGSKQRFVDPYLNSDLVLIGDIGMGVPRGGDGKKYYKEIEARKKANLFPYPDAFFTEFGDQVETLAQMLKNRVKVWILREEIDGWPDPIDNFRGTIIPSGGGTCEAERFVLWNKIAYERLKKVDPECIVAGMASGYQSPYNPRAVYVNEFLRKLQIELKDHFDMMAPDQGGGSLPKWPWPPELGWPDVIATSLKEAILQTQKTQVQLGKPTRNMIIAERGYAVPSHFPFDHPAAKMQANFIARSMIIAKSIPGVVYYGQFYTVCTEADPNSDDAHPETDYGLWKYMRGGASSAGAAGSDDLADGLGGAHHIFYPRAAVAAFATVANLLANVTEPEEINLTAGSCYGSVFKKNDKTISCLWTIDKTPCTVAIDLPAETECRDLMGNSRNLSAGKNEITLSESPIFLISRADRKALASAMQEMVFPALALMKGEAHLADAATLKIYLFNQSREPQNVEVQIDKGGGALTEAKTVVVPASSNTVAELTLPSEIDVQKTNAVSAWVKMKDQTLTLKADSSLIPVQKITVKGSIDGDLSKYAGIQPIVLDNQNHLYGLDWEAVTGPQGNMLWTNVNDLSVSCYLGWDEKYFYLAASVTDDAHVQPCSEGEIWRGDCFQFALDALNDALNPELTGKKGGQNAGDYNYGLALTANGPQLYCWADKGQTGSPGLRKFPMVIKRAGNKTVYEAAIPWENLTPLEPKAGKIFGFNFVVFDRDRTDDSQAVYWMGLTTVGGNPWRAFTYRKFMLMP